MAKKDRRQKHAANTNGEALVLQVERRERSTLLALTEGRIFAEVLSAIRYKIRFEDSGAEVSYIRKTKAGRVLVELCSKTTNTTNKRTFGEAVNGLLGEKALISNLKSTCSLEI